MAEFRVLSEAQVQALIDLPSAWRAVEEAYRQFGRSPEVQSRPPVMTIAGPRPTLGRAALGQYRIKGASLPDCGAAGAFLYTRDHPYLYLWDTDTDTPIGLVAFDWLNRFRVAVTVAVAIRLLAQPTVRKIAFFGAGKYASEPCRLLLEQWPQATLHVVAAHRASAEALAATLGPSVVPGESAQAAIEGAEVVVTLTNADGPFVQPGWLAPGALLLSMGSAHEVHASVLQEVQGLIVDDLPYACTQGDLAHWLRRGEITQEQISARLRANIGEIVAGLKPARLDPAERLLAILQGLTACDVLVAHTVLQRARAENIGQVVTI